MVLRTIIEGRIDHSTRDGQSSTDSYQSIQCRSHFNSILTTHVCCCYYACVITFDLLNRI